MWLHQLFPHQILSVPKRKVSAPLSPPQIIKNFSSPRPTSDSYCPSLNKSTKLFCTIWYFFLKKFFPKRTFPLGSLRNAPSGGGQRQSGSLRSLFSRQRTSEFSLKKWNFFLYFQQKLDNKFSSATCSMNHSQLPKIKFLQVTPSPPS